MGINVRVRDGMCPDPTTGEGGATEGDIRGSFSDIIDTIGVVDLANGHCLVTENSPAALSVLVAPGVVYIPNANYDELDSNTVKFWEAIITVSTTVTITANTSGSTRIDLICAKMDTAVTPDEHASNIATLVAVAGTPGAGAPTLPDNHAKLAEVEVADGAVTIVNADITDSRVQSNIKSEFGGGGNYIPTSYLDTDGTLAANSDTKLASQKAVKTYVDGKVTVTADSTTTFSNKDLSSPTNIITSWNTAQETWEYVSVDDPTGIFRVNADVTTKYSVGMRIKFTNATNVIYGIITGVGAYTGGYTSITFLHQIDPTDSLALVLMANSAITLNYYSTQKAPLGFIPTPERWTVYVLNPNSLDQLSPKVGTWYNLGSLNLVIPIGNWKIYYSVDLRVSAAAAGSSMYATLSTSNNSESDTSNTTGFVSGLPTDIFITNEELLLNLSSKTTYYLIAKTLTYSVSEINFRGSFKATLIKATCTYL